MNSTDLIERLKQATTGASQNWPYDLLEECITALSPVMPDEIKDIQMWLNTKGTETALRIADLLEKLARKWVWAEKDITRLTSQRDQLAEALEAWSDIHDDHQLYKDFKRIMGEK